MGGGGAACCSGRPRSPSPYPQQAPHLSAISGLSNGSPQRRLLYLLLLQSSPWAEESPLVCLQTAGSKQMQGLFANCHGPGLLQRPARWVQPCGFKSHLPQADSWVEPPVPSFPKHNILVCSWENGDRELWQCPCLGQGEGHMFLGLIFILRCPGYIIFRAMSSGRCLSWRLLHSERYFSILK